MKATITRTALAMAGMVLCFGQLHAEELGYSELENRLAKIENQLAGQNGLQQASHCCDSADGCCDVGCCDACGGGGCGSCDAGCCASSCCPSCGSVYGEVQFLFLRAHVQEDYDDDGSKLEENHDISPRFILGYENGCGMGGRIRYWNYDHSTGIENTNDSIAFEMNILDLEATQRFQGCRSDVVLAGGVRLGSWDSTDDDNDTVSIDNLLGLTMAADMRSQFAQGCNSELNLVGGGRMSLLGGDWDGNNNHDFIDTDRDDNIFVWELYAGVEYGVCYYDTYLFTRLAYEIQMWHSAVVDSSGDLDTLGFVGPAWTIGMAF